MLIALIIVSLVAFTLFCLWVAAINRVGDLVADLRCANHDRIGLQRVIDGQAKLIRADANGRVSRGEHGRFVSAKA